MTERMVWGAGPYPAGSETLGIIRHPRDNAVGVAIRLSTGCVVHGAAGVTRSLPRRRGKYVVIAGGNRTSVGR